MSQLHLNSTASCLNSLPLHSNHPEFLHINTQRHKSFPTSFNFRRKSLCFAVNDLKETDQLSNTLGVSSALEERPSILFSYFSVELNSGLLLILLLLLILVPGCLNSMFFEIRVLFILGFSVELNSIVIGV